VIIWLDGGTDSVVEEPRAGGEMVSSASEMMNIGQVALVFKHHYACRSEQIAKLLGILTSDECNREFRLWTVMLDMFSTHS